MSAAAIPLFRQNTWSASSPRASTAILRLPDSLSRLFALLDESGEDDYGQKGPSQLAFKTAFLLLAQAISILEEDVPAGAPSVDSEGGIRITWNHLGKQLKLVCPATKDTPVYIYQSSVAGTSLRNQNITASVLADRLAWLSTRESAAAR